MTLEKAILFFIFATIVSAPFLLVACLYMLFQDVREIVNGKP